MKQAPSLVPHWWRRALDDGKHCENKRRERWFSEYLIAAEEDLRSAGLLPVELVGPFTLLYRRGFRLGYDNAVRCREQDRVWLRKPKKRAKLGK